MSSCWAAALHGWTPARWRAWWMPPTWIDRETLLTSAERYGKSPYGQHLKNVADGKLRY